MTDQPALVDCHVKCSCGTTHSGKDVDQLTYCQAREAEGWLLFKGGVPVLPLCPKCAKK